MNYIDLEGTYFDAYQKVLQSGGQFYPGNGRDSACVVVQGNNCYTYWKPNSKRKGEIVQLCTYFDIDSKGQTGGRIARWLVSNLLELPYESTFWSKRYRALAKNGHHWHYSFVEPNQKFYAIEVDLKSAYFSSLLSGKSLLYQPEKGYLNDNNALENLRYLVPNLPKWFRLQLLGILASWKLSFLARDKKNLDSSELVLKWYHKISYNAAFNAVHRAILRNYKVMQHIHQIGGQYIKRMHTDSFFLEIGCPERVENAIWDYIESKGLVYDIKGCGLCYFFDVNTGFIGDRFVGASIDVADLMRQGGIKMQKTSYSAPVMDRFGKLINSSSIKPDEEELEKLENVEEAIQLSLFAS